MIKPKSLIEALALPHTNIQCTRQEFHQLVKTLPYRSVLIMGCAVFTEALTDPELGDFFQMPRQLHTIVGSGLGMFSQTGLLVFTDCYKNLAVDNLMDGIILRAHEIRLLDGRYKEEL